MSNRPQSVQIKSRAIHPKQKRALSQANIHKLSSLSKGDIRRLCRKAGVTRISSDIYNQTKYPPTIKFAAYFISTIVKDALIYRDYARRSTVAVEDVKRAFQRHGKVLCGFSDVK